MSKLVISNPNISKTDISYLLKWILMYTFQEVMNFIFKLDWLMFIKTNLLGLFENFHKVNSITKKHSQELNIVAENQKIFMDFQNTIFRSALQASLVNNFC